MLTQKLLNTYFTYQIYFDKVADAVDGTTDTKTSLVDRNISKQENIESCEANKLNFLDDRIVICLA
jgi:hypothetical protein